MTLTNALNLPEVIVASVENDDYSKGDADFSVTELVAPPQLVQLRRRYGHQIVQDVADLGFILLGKVAHGILERANLLNALHEERLFTTVDGVTISGALDHYVYSPEEVLYDLKVTSVYATKDGPKPEWIAQLNCYAELMRLHGFFPKRLEILPVYRDWRAAEARKAPGRYPEKMLDRPIPVPLWRMADTQRWLHVRVGQHTRAALLPDDQLYYCTDQERWARPEQWAVMKFRRKRAVKLYKDEASATEHANAPGLYVEHRSASYPRCESYCVAAPFCHQWKAGAPKS